MFYLINIFRRMNRFRPPFKLVSKVSDGLSPTVVYDFLPMMSKGSKTDDNEKSSPSAGVSVVNRKAATTSTAKKRKPKAPSKPKKNHRKIPNAS